MKWEGKIFNTISPWQQHLPKPEAFQDYTGILYISGVNSGFWIVISFSVKQTSF
jgi:hypothetical protein